MEGARFHVAAHVAAELGRPHAAVPAACSDHSPRSLRWAGPGQQIEMTAERWSRICSREEKRMAYSLGVESGIVEHTCSREHVHSIVFFSCVEYGNGRRDAKQEQ
jgi:hypothetical protein